LNSVGYKYSFSQIAASSEGIGKMIFFFSAGIKGGVLGEALDAGGGELKSLISAFSFTPFTTFESLLLFE
jgi:hypothetical protein